MQTNQQPYLHPQQPVLQSQHSDITNTNLANLLKIDYLTKQKQILETQIQQLELNNKLMRKINADIVHGQQINLQELVARNEQVQGMIRSVVEENRVLRTENFLAVQVNLDNQKQFRNILHNYQQKILQLRKSIQIKQSNIQSLEENHFLGAYWGTLDQKKISILFDYQQLKAQILQNRLKNMEYLKQIEKLNKEIKEYKEKISRLQLIMMAKPCYKEYLSGTDQIRAKSLPRILIPKLKNLEEKQKKSENFINCSNLCQTRPSFNKNANSTVFLGDINLLTYDERRKLIELKKIAHGKTIENQKLSNQIKTMKDRISALKAENKKLMQSNSIYQKSRRKVTEQSNRWQLLSNIFYNFLTQRRIIQHEAKNENLIQDDISFLKPKIKTSSKILQKKQKTNHHIKNQQWKQIKKELDKRILSISISTTRKRSYSCILDYITIPIEIKSKKEQINAEDEQFSLYLDNSGFIGKSVKNGTYQKQVQFSNLNQFEESGIFSDVLKNM